jgi:hypothetical protein
MINAPITAAISPQMIRQARRRKAGEKDRAERRARMFSCFAKSD